MATYYRSGSSEIYSRPEYAPGNAMIYTNSFSETFPRESTNNDVSPSKEIQVVSSFGGASQMVEVQDSGSWRDQEDNDRSCFPVMMRLGLSSQIETSRSNNNNNEYATQVASGFTRTIHNSKYLKAAQQLLDEAVNVKKALKQFQPEGDKISEEKEKILQTNIAEIPQAERQELQSKLSKLLSILDEVDRKYKQYYHQMQIVVSSFDVIAGCGAAKPYTALALQTISRHFRCLRDAISGQILVIRKSLGGEHDGSDGRGVGISRLRNVDQQVRQQRALQRLGVMQPHTWRPQRGLPDSSVLVLRAWLFEHFLHPYPKDSDKIMLARQTGLSRGQVSNWFINARVRLWKPMVEEMYKEEFTEALEENDPNLSSENTPEITEIQEQQTESSSNNGHASGVASSSMGQSTVAPGGDRFMMVTDMTRNGSGGMSLTLGIQNSDARGDVPMSGGIDNYENNISGTNFQYLNSRNHQHRLGSSNLLHDFVA
ncbi:PREDICTED: BEL1-like homeodomain protein 7 [Camelina sativa]|uniref:BEL1-like homeodomain protein 7 n=1 Tax=Camelina sativa TaxID=90675 RepID=A0ABM0W8U5_CAMSA|nr:PREDICTED: BEL1-like homeodomain protein 7 [Camelina sativa]XP_010467365.1 PREDICTED: BEL1-like homeodomain protein 7 [Camelina sativa]XP_010467366.1 PREDICTED: BEL1-like homeodomain protein 7 [Camelina sativa]